MSLRILYLNFFVPLFRQNLTLLVDRLNVGEKKGLGPQEVVAERVGENELVDLGLAPGPHALLKDRQTVLGAQSISKPFTRTREKGEGALFGS